MLPAVHQCAARCACAARVISTRCPHVSTCDALLLAPPHRLVTSTDRSGASAPERPAHLTPREREVLARIAAGMTSKEIAASLGVSLRTVNTHREHLAKKLSTSSVAALIRYAIDHGITDVG